MAAAGGAHRLPRYIPYHAAMAVLLAGKRLSASERTPSDSSTRWSPAMRWWRPPGDGTVPRVSLGGGRRCPQALVAADPYLPSFPNPSSTTTSMSVGPPRRVESVMAGPMSSGSVIRIAVTPIERASPVKSIAGSLNSMPV